ncbi:unnamed protein product [Gadus morhua 'NCC']
MSVCQRMNDELGLARAEISHPGATAPDDLSTNQSSACLEDAPAGLPPPPALPQEGPAGEALRAAAAAAAAAAGNRGNLGGGTRHPLSVLSGNTSHRHGNGPTHRGNDKPSSRGPAPLRRVATTTRRSRGAWCGPATSGRRSPCSLLAAAAVAAAAAARRRGPGGGLRLHGGLK